MKILHIWVRFEWMNRVTMRDTGTAAIHSKTESRHVFFSWWLVTRQWLTDEDLWLPHPGLFYNIRRTKQTAQSHPDVVMLWYPQSDDRSRSHNTQLAQSASSSDHEQRRNPYPSYWLEHSECRWDNKPQRVTIRLGVLKLISGCIRGKGLTSPQHDCIISPPQCHTAGFLFLWRVVILDLLRPVMFLTSVPICRLTDRPYLTASFSQVIASVRYRRNGPHTYSAAAW